MITKFCFVTAAMTASVQVFAGANLIRNGTFEGSATQHKWGGYWDSKGFSCPGWRFEGYSGIAKADGVWVAEKFSVGRYALFLQPWKDRHPSRDSDAAKFRGVYRDSWEMLWMTAIHMKAGCEFMLMGVDW